MKVAVIDFRGVDEVGVLVAVPEGAEEGLVVIELVVAHQGDAIAAQAEARADGEAPHAVGCSRDDQAVVHRLAGLGNDPVLKALGQVDDAERVTHQRAIARNLVGIGLGFLRQHIAGEAREGEGGRAAGQHMTP